MSFSLSDTPLLTSHTKTPERESPVLYLNAEELSLNQHPIRINAQMENSHIAVSHGKTKAQVE